MKKKINEKLDEQEESANSLAGDINNVIKIVGAKKKAFIYTIPKEKDFYIEFIDELKKKTNLDVLIYSVNDKNKYDPQNKAKKAKPGKPAIYLE